MLTTGIHGLYLAHVRDPNAVRVFVEACRFGHQTIGVGSGLGVGTRGHGAEQHPAARWGLSPIDYTRRADLWPLNPNGELILAAKVEDRCGLEHARAALAVPGLAFGEWGPGDMGLFFGHPEWKNAPYDDRMMTAMNVVRAACQKAGLRFLCVWDDPSMTLEAKVDLLVNEFGASILAGAEGERLATVGRRLTGRTMPV